MEDNTRKNTITIGLSKIEIGEIPADGSMATTLSQIGYTYKDTCTITQDDPEETEFYAEEEDDPIIVVSKGGKINFTFSVMNPSPEALVTLMGGVAKKSSESLTENDTWEAPRTQKQLEKAVRITPVAGYVLEIPRMKISAKINAELKSSGILLIECKGVVLAPTNASTPKLTASAKTE